MDNVLQLLLLEDNPEDAALIQLTLKRAGIGFVSIVASDEAEFLEALKQNTFHAVLADNALPQYSSVEALHMVRATNPHVAFILVTGTVSEEFAVQIIKQGADDYILKTNLTRLPAAVTGAVQKKKISREKEIADTDLHRISLHLENLKEQEQARIAREVHDQLGQLLTGLKMDIGWLRKHAGEKNDAQMLAEKLNAMNSLMDEAIQTVRRVASDLRPPILDDYGLTDALEWKGVEFETRSGIKVFFEPPETAIEIDNRVSTGLYRIYQEILTNIARHAGAERVDTRLENNEGYIVLTVTDNGKGFDTSKPVSSLGLLGMKERSYMIGGNLTINSKPGEGTSIIVTVPL